MIDEDVEQQCAPGLEVEEDSQRPVQPSEPSSPGASEPGTLAEAGVAAGGQDRDAVNMDMETRETAGKLTRRQPVLCTERGSSEMASRTFKLTRMFERLSHS